MRRLRIAMAQMNSTVGDFAGNRQKILDAIDRARALKVDFITFPELAICGYPPEDLLFKPQFIDENRKCLDSIIEASAGIAVMVGFVDAATDIYNAAAIINDGNMVGIYHKIYLPNYGVFDENRYFRAGAECPVFIINGVGIGVNICEDIWYEAGPATVQAYNGAEVIVNISASPYHFGKSRDRERMLDTRASDNVALLAYNNLVGGQDELVFDGASLIFNEKGQVIARGKQFEEDFIVADLDVESVFRARLHDPRWRKEPLATDGHRWVQSTINVSTETSSVPKPELPRRDEPGVLSLPAEIYSALVLGTRDYIRKNGFQKVVIGMSGGVDSSLVAAVAVDALGSENVTGVAMPSRFTSEQSNTDAALLARNLDMRLVTIPIEQVFKAYLDTLSPAFAETKPDITEENIQARIRGNLLMALSNKFGWLVLTTGNKSEYATGYTTLYGDMAGGFAVIKDVPKTTVYKLSRYRNTLARFDIIPSSILDREPTAELRPNQRDVDSLPPYEVLDPILTAYVEEDKNFEQILGMGFDEKYVRRAVRLVDTSEYKRRQSPPGVKITARAFGRDRRLPLTSRFRPC